MCNLASHDLSMVVLGLVIACVLHDLGLERVVQVQGFVAVIVQGIDVQY